ncbi:MAG: hypothetical protein EZS28_054979 [Streblomastix strix]|uniref:Uncharacterized protein n=1 Tax=Streblomastix strix TaxID=222440 RepID=A0A5J4Q8U3_9EUKA|nr:MAG: hypothetical protein EZS28_054979 [Streblomastix strix]
MKNLTTLCIGIVFKAREIENPLIRRGIILHLKSLDNDDDPKVKGFARKRLRELAINAVNRTEIKGRCFALLE